MKKVFCGVMAAVLLVSLLVGCGSKELTPIEKAQARAVEIGEQYLNFEITGEEARKLLDSIKVPAVETGNGQTYLDADISFLAFIIANSDYSYEEIEKRVKWIASFDYTE
jgi:predicted small lipoprotein YifL